MQSSKRSRFQRLSRSRWRALRRAALDRDGWRCTECGRAGRLDAHHVKPLEKGGEPYELGNLAALCRDCHIRAHGGEPRRPDAGYAALVAELMTGPKGRAQFDSPGENSATYE